MEYTHKKLINNTIGIRHADYIEPGHCRFRGWHKGVIKRWDWGVWETQPLAKIKVLIRREDSQKSKHENEHKNIFLN